MSLIFNDKDHSYKSIDATENIDWISVTTLVSKLKQPFNAKAVAEKVSKNKRSKWFGLKPSEIQEIWKKESERALALGTHYHNQREADLCSFASIERDGINVPIYKPIYKDGVKIAPEQKLSDGIYPEHFVYLKSAGICGQSDLVEVVNNTVKIIDYKSNKEIKTEGFKNWEGITDKMLAPVHHLDNCDFYHYALQLSIYMYIIIKHNPKLKPGKIFVHHVLFEEEGRDQYDYPITKYDENGDPIVKEIIPIELPYLKSEVVSIINWLHDNRKTLKK